METSQNMRKILRPQINTAVFFTIRKTGYKVNIQL